MTRTEFILAIENLYEPYKGNWKTMILDYLETWDESDIDKLFRYLIIRYKFPSAPILGAIEDARREFSERYDRTLGKDWYMTRSENQIQEKLKMENHEIVEASPEEAEGYFSKIRAGFKNVD